MAGIVLLTLGALNAVLALSVETCTQGSADSLYGGYITLALYCAGAAALIAYPPRRWAFVALAPAAAIAFWHSAFAVRFAWGYWREGMSACFAMDGNFTPELAGQWMDGGEPGLTLLWAGLSALFWIAAVLGLRRSLRRPAVA